VVVSVMGYTTLGAYPKRKGEMKFLSAVLASRTENESQEADSGSAEGAGR